jgi:ribosomal protein S18 acetylase RimI-like enzyme
MANITFTRAIPTDIPLLQTLARQIWLAHYPGIISVAQIEYMLDRMYASDVIDREMQTGVCWELIRHDGETVGFLSYWYEEAVARLKLHKLYVLPERHGQGLGRAGLGEVREIAVALGAREISLYVNKNNPKAIRAYERAGFTVAESVTTEIGGDFVMDDYRMTVPCKP